MRLLLINDNYGELEIINELAGHVRADAVIHARDFGFFDDGSIERLSYREVRLHVAYSHLPQNEKDRILAHSRNDMIEVTRKHRLLGEFQSFVDGNGDRPSRTCWASPKISDGSRR